MHHPRLAYDVRSRYLLPKTTIHRIETMDRFKTITMNKYFVFSETKKHTNYLLFHKKSWWDVSQWAGQFVRRSIIRLKYNLCLCWAGVVLFDFRRWCSDINLESNHNENVINWCLAIWQWQCRMVAAVGRPCALGMDGPRPPWMKNFRLLIIDYFFFIFIFKLQNERKVLSTTAYEKSIRASSVWSIALTYFS